MTARAATLGALALALSLAAPGGSAVAQKKRDFVPRKQNVAAPKQRKPSMKKGPQLGGERFVRRKTERMA